MATIASLAVQLIADPTRLVGGLRVAQASIQKFGKSGLNPGVWAKLASSGLAKMQGAIDSVVGPMKNLIGNIPLIGGALASIPTSVGGVMEWFKEGSGRINDMRIQSQKLGIDIEKMGGLMLAAGPASESMAMSMLRLQKELGEAAMKAEGTEVTFARLGLNAKQLSQVPLDAALGAIADKINQLDNQAAKGAAVFSIFGKRGAELMPLLARGSAGLEMFQQRAQQLGLAVSAIDAENVRQATLAMKQMDFWMQAAKQSIAIELAPIVTALAEQFKDVGINAKSVGEYTLGFAKIMAYTGAVATEAGKGIRLVWDVISLGVRGTIAGIANGIALLLEQAAKLPDSLGGETFRTAAVATRNFANDIWQGMIEDRKAFWDRWANDKDAVRATAAFFDEVQARIDAQRKKLGKAPTDNNAAFTRLFELFERGQKITQENADPLAKFNDRMAELNELVKAGAIQWDTYARAAGKAVIDLHQADQFTLGTETALEKFNDKVQELNQLLDLGAIHWDVYERAVFGAAKSIMDLNKAENVRLSETQEFGSQAAYETINRAIVSGRSNNSGLEALKEAIKQQTELEKRQQKDIADIARAARAGFLAKGRI